MITTTLNRIRAHKPCKNGWEKLLVGLGKTMADDEPLPFSKIVEINDLDDALWCCRVEPEYSKEWRLFAVWCARQVQHLMNDERSIDALEVAERFANGKATQDELVKAHAKAVAVLYTAKTFVAFAPANTAVAVADKFSPTVAWTTSRACAMTAPVVTQKNQFLEVVGASL